MCSKEGNVGVCLRVTRQPNNIHCPSSMTSLMHHFNDVFKKVSSLKISFLFKNIYSLDFFTPISYFVIHFSGHNYKEEKTLYPLFGSYNYEGGLKSKFRFVITFLFFHSTYINYTSN